jgi:hypothetical protein
MTGATRYVMRSTSAGQRKNIPPSSPVEKKVAPSRESSIRETVPALRVTFPGNGFENEKGDGPTVIDEAAGGASQLVVGLM